MVLRVLVWATIIESQRGVLVVSVEAGELREIYSAKVRKLPEKAGQSCKIPSDKLLA